MVGGRLHRQQLVALLAHRLAERVQALVHVREGERYTLLLQLRRVVVLDVRQAVLPVSATCHAYLDQGDRRLDLRVDRSLLRVVDRLHTALQHVEEIAEAQIQSPQTHDALCILRMRVLRTTGCHLLFISILFTTGETNPQIKYLLDFASLLTAPFPTRVSKRLTALSTALAKETNLWMYVRRDYASVAPFSTLTRGRWDKETRIVSTSIPMTMTTVLS